MSAILDDPLMLPLGVVCCGRDCDVRDDGVAFLVPTPENPGQWLTVAWDEFDALVARGWVDLVGADEFEASDAGIYWFRRWTEREEKRHRRAHPRAGLAAAGRKRMLRRRR